jgi:high-affinity iron transporter
MHLFSVQLFFVVFREALEVAIIISVMLGFIGRIEVADSRKFRKKLWLGTLLGCLIILVVGATIITIWYRFGKNVFESVELLYEGSFGILASVIITITAFAFLKGQNAYERLTQKLEVKLALTDNDSGSLSEIPPERLASASRPALDEPHNAEQLASSLISSLDQYDSSSSISSHDSSSQEVLLEKSDAKKIMSANYFFYIPLFTLLREGVEMIVLIAGVSFQEAPTAIPLAAIAGIIAGCLVGYLVHRLSSTLSLKWFFVTMSYLLFLIAAGLLSRSVGLFEDHYWARAINLAPDDAQTAQFDPRTNVWYLACCHEKRTAGFQVLYAIFGYRSVATIGTIVSYCLYWLLLSGGLVAWKNRKLR